VGAVRCPWSFTPAFVYLPFRRFVCLLTCLRTRSACVAMPLHQTAPRAEAGEFSLVEAFEREAPTELTMLQFSSQMKSSQHQMSFSCSSTQHQSRREAPESPALSAPVFPQTIGPRDRQTAPRFGWPAAHPSDRTLAPHKDEHPRSTVRSPAAWSPYLHA